ncbi:MAG: heme biosynthesis HemY N-terminal domain-containing protein [Pseudomonadota bacterium]
MIRVLIFLLSVIFVAGAITYFAGMTDWIEAEAFGSKFDIHAGFAIGALFLSTIGVILLTVWIKDLAALPGKIRARDREAKRTRGVAALTRGLEAVMLGDAADAQHHARVAQRNLQDDGLTRLLTARAAELAGDEKAAGENFTAMLEAPETEFMGLQGLYQKAMRDDDKAAARGFAERAFRLRPNAKWAFDSVFELGLDRGAWGETRDALSTAQKNKVVNADKARRGEAALLTADAYAAALSGDNDLALQEAEAALKLAPSFAPAATLAAEQHHAKGKRNRAAKILEQAFAEAPHPALTKSHFDLFKDEPAEKQAEQLKKIADRKPTAREAKLNVARRLILLEEFDEASGVLEPLLMEKATARETAAMAEAVAGAKGADAAKPWLEQAAAAPRDPSPGADGAFHFTRDGWARLVREYMDHGRLAPPPLEDAPRGLSLDEMKLLAPPVVVEEITEADVEDEEKTDASESAASPDDDAPPSDLGDLGDLDASSEDVPSGTADDAAPPDAPEKAPAKAAEAS